MSEGAKNTHLRSPMSKEKFVAKLASTLQAGGQVEAPLPEPKIGDKMPDGTIYAGISSITGQPMYTTPADAPRAMTLVEARKYARASKAHGHDDWDLPELGDLAVLFNNRAAIGGFNPGPYWSGAMSYDDCFYFQRFNDGALDPNGERNGSRMSVRLVRSDAPKR